MRERGKKAHQKTERGRVRDRYRPTKDNKKREIYGSGFAIINLSQSIDILHCLNTDSQMTDPNTDSQMTDQNDNE